MTRKRKPPAISQIRMRRLRALRLIGLLLRSRRPVATADLQAELGVSRATLHRLRDDARAAGLTIESDEDPNGARWRLIRAR